VILTYTKSLPLYFVLPVLCSAFQKTWYVVEMNVRLTVNTVFANEWSKSQLCSCLLVYEPGFCLSYINLAHKITTALCCCQLQLPVPVCSCGIRSKCEWPWWKRLHTPALCRYIRYRWQVSTIWVREGIISSVNWCLCVDDYFYCQFVFPFCISVTVFSRVVNFGNK
jgi:hypothetical protein